MIIIKECKTPDEIEACFAIRKKVFIEEQHVPLEIERDSRDAAAAHFLAFIDKTPVGTIRLVKSGKNAKLQRLAVTQENRGKGIAKELIKAFEKKANEIGCKKVITHAQLHAKEFYEKMNYKATGKEFMEAEIKHIPMHKLI